MNDDVAAPAYAGCRFPAAIIGHAVWLYCRCALSYRDVEGLLAARGVIVTDETVRQWCQKFGQAYADALRWRRPRSGDTWPLDEVFVRIGGVTYYLWRAVDQGATSSPSWSKAVGTRLPRCGSCGRCLRAWQTCRVC